MDRYLVISSDGHVGLPPEKYRDDLEQKFHAEFDVAIAKEIKAREEREKLFLINDFNTKWRAKVGDGLEGAAGLLAARSGATVLPVAVLGGSGRHPGDPPAWRSRIDVVVGEPCDVPEPRDHLSRSEVLRVAEIIRQCVLDHARVASIRAGAEDGVAIEPADGAAENGAL